MVKRVCFGDFGSETSPGLVCERQEATEAVDPVAFAREKLGFNPDEKQMAMLRGGKRGILNCSRQWGKSTVAAAKAVHRAYSDPGSLTLLLTPSGRQSGEFMRKSKEFVRRLGIRVRGDGENKASVLLPNGSRIIGLPESAAVTVHDIYRLYSHDILHCVSHTLLPDRVRATARTRDRILPCIGRTGYPAGKSIRKAPAQKTRRGIFAF